MWFDAHNHLQDEWLAPHRARILADLAAAGVGAGVVNGTCEADWPVVAALCERRDQRSVVRGQPLAPSSGTTSLDAQPGTLNLLPSFGLHPWDAGNRTPDWQRALVARLDADPRAAIGEIGLDRWILDRARPDDPRLAGLRRAPLDEQSEVFRWQLALAAERNLPASIHCLDAFGAMHDVLRRTPRPARGLLLHAYSGPAEMVPAFAKLGAYFSFNGYILKDVPPEQFHVLREIDRWPRRLEVFRRLPAERLLVETDAPAMRLPAGRETYPPLATPDGSQANHPGNIVAAYAALAELRGLSVESLAALVAENFARLFGPV